MTTGKLPVTDYIIIWPLGRKYKRETFGLELVRAGAVATAGMIDFLLQAQSELK